MPVFHIVLLALLLKLAAAQRAASLRLIFASVIAAVGTEALVRVRTVPEVTATTGMLDMGWLVSIVLFGASALHPSMRRVHERAIPSPARLTRTRIALLLGVALVTPTVLAVLAVAGRPVGLPVALGGSAALFSLVFARMSSLAGEEHARGRWRELVLEIVQATEAERCRIAADLHDGPIQRLAKVTITAGIARHRLAHGDLDGGRRLLEGLEGQVRAEIHTLRQLMSQLHPPALEDLGLEAALAQHAAVFTRRTGTVCEVTVQTPPLLDVSRAALVYRVVQEALNNVDKHADARSVQVLLGVDGQTVRLDVRDDGVGFAVGSAGEPPGKGHFGLVSMRQRVAMAGGTLEVRSRPGCGTALTVCLPRPTAASPT